MPHNMEVNETDSPTALLPRVIRSYLNAVRHIRHAGGLYESQPLDLGFEIGDRAHSRRCLRILDEQPFEHIITANTLDLGIDTGHIPGVLEADADPALAVLRVDPGVDGRPFESGLLRQLLQAE